VEIAIQFAPGGIWLEPIRFQAGDEDVVTVHYFSGSDGQAETPAMQAKYWVIPGINDASALGPIVSGVWKKPWVVCPPLGTGGDVKRKGLTQSV